MLQAPCLSRVVSHLSLSSNLTIVKVTKRVYNLTWGEIRQIAENEMGDRMNTDRMMQAGFRLSVAFVISTSY